MYMVWFLSFIEIIVSKIGLIKICPEDLICLFLFLCAAAKFPFNFEVWDLI